MKRDTSVKPDKILEKSCDDFDLFLTINHSETEGRLTIKPKKANLPISPEELLRLLRDLGIKEGVKADIIAECCRKLENAQPVQDIIVAQGSLPEAGRDAALEFLLHISSKNPTFTEDRAGNIDFHETHLFENVHLGHELAVINPAVPGSNGHTITGRIIPAPVPKECPVKAGDGVRYQPHDSTFVSLKDGRIIFKNNTIQVSDEFLVEGDVNFHVGNINFEGFVTVRGDVLDGFRIKATRGIQIDKNVGNCRLECNGDIKIGGMNGRGIDAGAALEHMTAPHPNTTGTILCEGNLSARYLHHMYIECGGNIVVAKEIRHSVIKAAGSITVQGQIMGGEYMALAGIEAAEIGSEMGVLTEITVGEDYRTLSRRAEAAETLEHFHKERQTLMNEIGPGPYTPHYFAVMLPHVRKSKLNVLSRISKLDEQATELKKELAALKREVTTRKNPKINIIKEMNPDTTLHIGNTTERITKPVTGPVSIIEFDNNFLLFTKMTPLAKQADEMEKELRELEQQTTLEKAIKLGINPEGLEKTDLIRAIQTREGYTPCFKTSDGTCIHTNCCWRRDCLQVCNSHS